MNSRYDTFSPEKIQIKDHLQASPSFQPTIDSENPHAIDARRESDVCSVHSQSSEQIELLYIQKYFV